ncbi:MAG: hypothetical protein JXA04_02630 [Gammaproteobacteria bacterium]|nr:hypothetical protein [Gammaproteobacteria bacterium]
MSTNNLSSLPALILLSSLLIACGGDEVGVDADPPNIPAGTPPEPTQIDIQETPLPIIEDFGAVDAIEFFSSSYQALATPAANEILDDDGNPFIMVDPWPSFYYPTCCFFQTDDVTGEVIRTPPYADDMDYRLKVGNNKMAISNARFTVGQILSDLTSPAIPDRKRDTTDNPAGASLADGSWGELDLSEPYRVSFCLVDFGEELSGASNIEVWVDNNSGGRQLESIHSSASLLLRAALTGSGVSLVSGNRVVVNVPGDAYMVNNAEERVGPTLGVVQPLDGLAMPVGTFSSFLQLRVSTGGYAVISDLIIEKQTENNAASLLNPCTVDTAFWVPSPPPSVEGTPFTGLPLNVDATVGEVEFFAQDGNTGNFLSISDALTDRFYKEVSSSSRIFVEAADNAVRFGNALWTMGLKTGAQDDGTTPNGDIDLSVAYRISMNIVTPPANPTYRLQVQIDNSTGTAASSVHGADSRIANLAVADGLVDGALVINVPGNITMNGSTIGSVPALIGTTTSFIAFRCPSDSGASCADADATSTTGLSLGNIVVDYQ